VSFVTVVLSAVAVKASAAVVIMGFCEVQFLTEAVHVQGRLSRSTFDYKLSRLSIKAVARAS